MASTWAYPAKFAEFSQRARSSVCKGTAHYTACPAQPYLFHNVHAVCVRQAASIVVLYKAVGSSTEWAQSLILASPKVQQSHIFGIALFAAFLALYLNAQESPPT